MIVEIQNSFERFFDCSPQPMGVLTVGGRFISVNQRFLSLLGYRSEDLCSLLLINFVHTDDQKQVERTLRRLESEAKGCEVSTEVSCRFRSAAGGFVPLDWSFALEPDSKHIFAIARKANQPDLDRQLLEETQRIAHIGSWELDLATERMYWSDEVYRFYGLSNSIRPDLTFGLSKYVPEDRAKLRAAIDRSAQQAVPFDLKVRFLTTKYREIWVRAKGRPITDNEGKIVAVRGVFQNIDEDERVRHQLTKRGEELQAIFDAFPDLFFRLDEHGTYIDFKAGLKETFMPPEMFMGKRINEVFPNEMGRHLMNLHLRCLETQQIVYDRYSLPTEHGDEQHFEARYLPLAEREVLVVVREVTELVEAQRNLEKSVAELQRSNIELEQFAFVASHDLQEPLRMIGNFTQLLKTKYSGGFDERGQRYLDITYESAQRMQSLIFNLLEYSRVGRRETEFEPVKLSELLSEKLADLNLLVEDRQAQIVLGDLPDTIWAEANQIGLVFYNLLHNALKFNDHPGATVRLDHQLTDTGDHHFTVTDEGIGIDQKFESKVFLIFQRLHGKKAYGGGTGIGLSLCKKIVERHGGRIWFEPNATAGTIFHFTLKRRLVSPAS